MIKTYFISFYQTLLSIKIKTIKHIDLMWLIIVKVINHPNCKNLILIQYLVSDNHDALNKLAHAYALKYS